MSLSNEAIANGKELAEQNTSLKNGACLLGWQLRSPCGESTLPNAKIELDGQKVSSNQIKGSKLQWFPRSKLKLTTKYNNRLTRTFNSYGVKYGDFTVVPTTRLDELKSELDEIKRDWQDEVTVLITLLGEDKISYTTAQKTLEKLYENKFDVKQYIEENNLIQVQDDSLIEELVRKALQDNPKAVEDYKGGNTKSLNFIVGVVMRETKGTAKPQVVNKIMFEVVKEF